MAAKPELKSVAECEKEFYEAKRKLDDFVKRADLPLETRFGKSKRHFVGEGSVAMTQKYHLLLELVDKARLRWNNAKNRGQSGKPQAIAQQREEQKKETAGQQMFWCAAYGDAKGMNRIEKQLKPDKRKEKSPFTLKIKRVRGGLLVGNSSDRLDEIKKGPDGKGLPGQLPKDVRCYHSRFNKFHPCDCVYNFQSNELEISAASDSLRKQGDFLLEDYQMKAQESFLSLAEEITGRKNIAVPNVFSGFGSHMRETFMKAE